VLRIGHAQATGFLSGFVDSCQFVALLQQELRNLVGGCLGFGTQQAQLVREVATQVLDRHVALFLLAFVEGLLAYGVSRAVGSGPVLGKRLPLLRIVLLVLLGVAH